MTKTTSAFCALAAALSLAGSAPADTLRFPGNDPGPAMATRSGHVVTLANKAISQSWTTGGGHLRPGAVVDELAGRSVSAPAEAFTLVLRDGKAIRASAMKIIAPVAEEALPVNPQASRLADRIPGRQVKATLETPDASLRVDWRAMLRDGGNYVRQEIVIRPAKDLDVARIVMVDHKLPGEADVCGTVPGSPVVAGTLFTAFEHPMSASQVTMGFLGQTRTVQVEKMQGEPEVEDDAPPLDPPKLRDGLGRHHATCWLERALPLAAGKTFTCSSVIGVTPEEQLRRGFLYYVERERAHPYRTFLHYNSWYDIGYFTRYNESDCLGSIAAFATELGEKRGVTMDSFLFDDGWDDTAKGGAWKFHDGFPNGFIPLKEAAAKCGAAPGVWLSPWGGYGKPCAERVKSGMAAGFETDGRTNDTKFALSGPKYYESFHKACLEMVTQYGINQFKLDGTGNIDSVVPNSRFGSDFEAAIQLIEDLRAVRPDLYINLTTGTWPSPFWLPICDSIWRGGWDHQFAGIGSARQRWITYRDADTYERVVRGGPLYPVNSLMLHGIIYAQHANKLDKDPENDFRSEARSYFGAGTQLQEMYISHGLLTETNWNDLAQCASWSRSNATVLVDTHWIGGNPRKLERYGWASWSPEKGILTIRNPDEEERRFTVELARFFELPKGAPEVYTLESPYKQRKVEELQGPMNAHTPVKIQMRPFEVLVFEARPAAK
jgi:hypothetical protein